MFFWMLLFLIFISILIIFVIIFGKFPILVSLDVDNILTEKEARFKEKIISNKLKRSLFKWSYNLKIFFTKSNNKVNLFLENLYKKLYQTKKIYDQNEIINLEKKNEKILNLFKEVNRLLDKKEFLEAERKLVEIIGFDSANVEAFKILGELYLENKNYKEAKQTFNHILKLLKDQNNSQEVAKIFFNLSLVDKFLGDFKSSLTYIKKALKIEPNNPKYLDTGLNVSIINKDKISAFNMYKVFEEINPDNKKLEEFKNEINEL